MGEVAVFVLHPPLSAAPGPLAADLDRARRALSARHVERFRAAGAARAVVIEEAETAPFGARLRRLVREHASARPGGGGMVVLGSGAMPLARDADYRAFIAAAAADARGALANNRFSADAVAVARAGILRDLPDLPTDNALPRWLEEVAGYAVVDLRRRWRLGIDLDSPADVLLVGGGLPETAAASPFRARLEALGSVIRDRRAELLVAGRTSTATLTALERRAPCRVRALVEERGLRAASRLAQSPDAGGSAGPAAHGRPPASALGMLLDRDGPESLGAIVARLGDAAAIDTRVLLAHRLGADEASWPPAEERFSSDLLLADRISDPWLRALTAAAVEAPVPIALGGHTLVGPGLRLLVERGRHRPEVPADRDGARPAAPRPAPGR